MQEILIRAGCFVAIIILGVLLRRIGWFQEKDFSVLSTVVLKLTLPASIVVSFNGSKIDMSLLILILLGLGGGLIYMGLGYLINLRRGSSERAFAVLNMAGYNIGNFTMPFVQSFLGSSGVIITSLFDTGNAMVCLGGAYGVAGMVKDGSRFSVVRVVKTVFKSVPFCTYLVMLALCLMKLSLPGAVMSFVQIIANAAPFMAMLMIGVGFRLKLDKANLGYIVKYILIRYGVAAILACLIYFCTGFSFEVRRTLVILVFAPFCTAAPAFTSALGEDVGLSSAINSISIIVSIVIDVALLSVMV